MKTVNVRNIVIGEGIPKVCIPLTEKDLPGLFEEAKLAAASGADIVEWRADCFDLSAEAEKMSRQISEALERIRQAIGEIPLLFTFRTFEEGGSRPLTEEDYFILNRNVVLEGKADLIDLEYARNEEKVGEVIREARKRGMFVILSQHDFTQTPSEESMIAIYENMQDAGADITKLAVMPHDCADVYKLLSVANIMKTKIADRPFIAISMGEEGMISRVFAESIGSAVSYGAGKNASAPGQLRAGDLRTILDEKHEKGLPKRIFLIGFMGSGKSTVGKHLSLLLRYRFVDMDSLIEEREGMSIPLIFELSGEEYFRNAENSVLKELAVEKHIVVSCGGGLVGNGISGEMNEAVLKGNAAIIFIKDRIESMFGRIAHDKGRPLTGSELRGSEEQFERLAALYEDRLPRYERAATWIADGTDKDPYGIAVEILEHL